MKGTGFNYNLLLTGYLRQSTGSLKGLESSSVIRCSSSLRHSFIHSRRLLDLLFLRGYPLAVGDACINQYINVDYHQHQNNDDEKKDIIVKSLNKHYFNKHFLYFL